MNSKLTAISVTFLSEWHDGKSSICQMRHINEQLSHKILKFTSGKGILWNAMFPG